MRNTDGGGAYCYPRMDTLCIHRRTRKRSRVGIRRAIVSLFSLCLSFALPLSLSGAASRCMSSTTHVNPPDLAARESRYRGSDAYIFHLIRRIVLGCIGLYRSGEGTTFTVRVHGYAIVCVMRRAGRRRYSRRSRLRATYESEGCVSGVFFERSRAPPIRDTYRPLFAISRRRETASTTPPAFRRDLDNS